MRMRVLESLGCNKCRLRMFSFLAKYVCDNFIIYANVVAGKFVKCPPFNLIVTDCRSPRIRMCRFASVQKLLKRQNE